MKVLLHPSYFPSTANFVAIAHADEVVWEIQDNFTKQTYRNRCYIYGSNGKLSLNVPVVHSQKNRQNYQDVKIFNEDNWQAIHWKSLLSAYSTSPFFEFYRDELQPLFETEFDYLMELNIKSFEAICDCLQLEIKISKTEIFQKSYASTDDYRFLINAKKEYKQNFEPYVQVFVDKHGFFPNLSILDLLFNEGPNSSNYLKAQKIMKPS